MKKSNVPGTMIEFADFDAKSLVHETVHSFGGPGTWFLPYDHSARYSGDTVGIVIARDECHARFTGSARAMLVIMSHKIGWVWM